MRELSPLHKERLTYKPKLAGALQSGIQNIKVSFGAKTSAVKDAADIQNLFSHVYGEPIATFDCSNGSSLNLEAKNVGVILSGGQAPGGHNVIAGLYDALKAAKPKN